ncbi:hypothetical protein KFK09_018055 [Dendrobium nobile]|uniref:Uncharacterized protein n=1 Tax=Dendrobium nobile TaxID=94219 RepID=A0A8T3AUR6_DENNO|nr:hypothetical protein KFK09_018055 [Dendrobium nobile]
MVNLFVLGIGISVFGARVFAPSGLPLFGLSKEVWLRLLRWIGDGFRWDLVPLNSMNVITLFFEDKVLIVEGLMGVEISGFLSDNVLTVRMRFKMSGFSSEEVVVWPLGFEVFRLVFLHYDFRIMEFETLSSYHFLSSWEFWDINQPFLVVKNIWCPQRPNWFKVRISGSYFHYFFFYFANTLFFLCLVFFSFVLPFLWLGNGSLLALFPFSL